MIAVDLVEDYHKALGTYQRISALDLDPVQRANIQRKVGDIYSEISRQ